MSFLSRVFDRLADLLPRRAGCVLVASLLLTALAAAQVVDLQTGRLRLEVDPSADRLLPEDHASRRFYDRIRLQFGSDEVLLVALATEDVFQPATLERIVRLTRRLGVLEGVHHVLSVTNAVDVRIVDGDLEAAAFVQEVPRDPAALAALRARVLANPVYGPVLVSADGRVTALLVHFVTMSNRAYLQSGLGPRIAAIAAEEAGPSEVWITGGPRVREEMARILLGEAFRLSLAILAALGVVLAIAFRSLRGVAVPLLTIAVAVTWTLAVVVHLGHSLNAVTALVPPLLTALGLSYSVHVVSEVQAAAREGGERGSRELVSAAMRRVTLPVVLTALTTAAGFASLLLSPLGAIREFGLYAVIGVGATLLASLSFAPGLLALLPVPRPAAAAARSGGAPGFERFVARVARFDHERRRSIFAVAAAVFVLALVGASQVKVGTRQITGFRSDAPVRLHFEAVNAHLQGANPFTVVLESDAPDAFKEPANLRVIEDLEAWLTAQPEIGGTTSLVDYLKLVHRGFSDDPAVAAEIPQSRRLVSQLLFFGASDELERFVNLRYQITAIQVRARVVDSDAVADLTRRIERRLAQLPEHLVGQVTGTSVVLVRTLDQVIRGQVWSVLTALGIIYAILAAMFVSMRIGLIALLPNVLPVVAYYGALGLTGIRLDTATSLVAPMVIGIAVDDTIHYFARFIREARRTGDERRATSLALGAVGRPVTYSSAALCLGFLMLNGSEMRGQADLGNMAAFALGFAWLTDFFLTPALCARLRIVTLWDLLSVDLGRAPQRSLAAFRGLRAAQARIVALMGRMVEVRDGDRLFNTGEPGEALYVVIEGRLRVSLRREDGALEIASHGRGEVVGEVGLFHAERSADADAVGDTRLLRIGEDAVAQLTRRYPRIAAVLLRNLNEIMAGRLARATRWLGAAGPRPAAPPAAAPELHSRGRALEDVFFRSEADRYRRELRLREQQAGTPEAVSDASGLIDPAVVDRLAGLGIGADTLAALTLIPLVEVAWADGRMDRRERASVLAGAEASGLDAESPGFALLRFWLEERPPPELLDAWRAYMEAVCHELSVETRLRLAADILGRARQVAVSAGGVLGVAAISSAEEAMLAALEAPFGTRAPSRGLREPSRA